MHGLVPSWLLAAQLFWRASGINALPSGAQGCASTDAEELAVSLPVSAAAMLAGGKDRDLEPASLSGVGSAPDVLSPMPVLTARQQTAHVLPSKRSWGGGPGRQVSAATRHVSEDSLPSISEVFGAAGSALATGLRQPVTDSAPLREASAEQHLGKVRGKPGVAWLNSGWSSRASEASSATLVNAPSLDASASLGAVKDRHAAITGGDWVTGSPPEPLLSVAASVDEPSVDAGRPLASRLSSFASAAGGEVQPGSKLSGPLLSKAGSSGLGSIGSGCAGALIASLASSGSALPGAASTALACTNSPGGGDEQPASVHGRGTRRSRLSVASPPNEAQVQGSNDTEDGHESAPADVVAAVQAGDIGSTAMDAVLQAQSPPASGAAGLRELPPSELEARVSLAEQLHGSRAPQVWGLWVSACKYHTNGVLQSPCGASGAVGLYACTNARTADAAVLRALGGGLSEACHVSAS